MSHFIAEAIKFGGNQASIVGDTVAIAETSLTENKDAQYYADQARYIGSILAVNE